jgi:anti-sigma B factor antagonist
LIPGKSTDSLSVHISELPQHKGITILTVKGYMDTTTAPEFEKHFQSALSAHKFKLVIDLKDVDYISSAGWGIFVSEIKRIRLEKGDLVLSGMNPEVEEIFKLLEFDTFLKSYDTVEEAVAGSFSGFPSDPKKDKPAGRRPKEAK